MPQPVSVTAMQMLEAYNAETKDRSRRMRAMRKTVDEKLQTTPVAVTALMTREASHPSAITVSARVGPSAATSEPAIRSPGSAIPVQVALANRSDTSAFDTSGPSNASQASARNSGATTASLIPKMVTTWPF